MKKLIEWIMYSLDIEMAQKLPIAVSFSLNQYILLHLKNLWHTLREGVKHV